MNMIRQKLEMDLRHHSPARQHVACGSARRCVRHCMTLHARWHALRVACEILRDRQVEVRLVVQQDVQRVRPKQRVERPEPACGTVSHAARYPMRHGSPRGNDDARRTTCSRRRRCSPSPLGDGPSSPCTSPAQLERSLDHAACNDPYGANSAGIRGTQHATREMQLCAHATDPRIHLPIRPSSHITSVAGAHSHERVYISACVCAARGRWGLGG